jgi:hypothetical protein
MTTTMMSNHPMQVEHPDHDQDACILLETREQVIEAQLPVLRRRFAAQIQPRGEHRRQDGGGQVTDEGNHAERDEDRQPLPERG